MKTLSEACSQNLFPRDPPPRPLWALVGESLCPGPHVAPSHPRGAAVPRAPRAGPSLVGSLRTPYLPTLNVSPQLQGFSKFGSQTIYWLDGWNRVNSFSPAKVTGWVSRDRCVAPRGENILGVSIFGRIEWCGKCEALDSSLCQRFSRVAKVERQQRGLSQGGGGRLAKLAIASATWQASSLFPIKSV